MPLANVAAKVLFFYWGQLPIRIPQGCFFLFGFQPPNAA
jgi:hypothetical protein